MRGTLVICTDFESLSREAAHRFLAAVEERPAKEAGVRVALAGGSTPRHLYELLAGSEFGTRIPWERIHFFWGDERLVPHDHPESNYRMAQEALLKHVPVPPENVHPVPVQASPENTAQSYEEELRRQFGQRRGFPAFDLVLLGLGADGHTASLFPRAPALEIKDRWVMFHIPGSGRARVTLTLPVLNQARRVFFLVSGEDKAEALRLAVEGTGSLPAQRVAPRKGELLWLVDTPAARRLERVKIEQ